MTDAIAMPTRVKFGKHRDKHPLTLTCDPDYVDWVKNNIMDWVQQRHPDLAHILINDVRFAAIAADSPAHNKLQAMFLDETYRRAFCRVAIPEWEETVWKTFQGEVAYHSKGAQA